MAFAGMDFIRNHKSVLFTPEISYGLDLHFINYALSLPIKMKFRYEHRY